MVLSLNSPVGIFRHYWLGWQAIFRSLHKKSICSAMEVTPRHFMSGCRLLTVWSEKTQILLIATSLGLPAGLPNFFYLSAISLDSLINSLYAESFWWNIHFSGIGASILTWYSQVLLSSVNTACNSNQAIWLIFHVKGVFIPCFSSMRLTHCGLLMQYNVLELGQHWIR